MLILLKSKKCESKVSKQRFIKWDYFNSLWMFNLDAETMAAKFFYFLSSQWIPKCKYVYVIFTCSYSISQCLGEQNDSYGTPKWALLTRLCINVQVCFRSEYSFIKMLAAKNIKPSIFTSSAHLLFGCLME